MRPRLRCIQVEPDALCRKESILDDVIWSVLRGWRPKSVNFLSRLYHLQPWKQRSPKQSTHFHRRVV
ncbi:hypothetical protein BJY00DRAFT_286978 [Aspergillus carlsbadensis]|nr:hypothetical protein BJY00DRAFT_286978 [Aspergillus carlsbadensis]